VPPLWKWLYLHISAVNYPISIKFSTRMHISISRILRNRNFANSKWRTDAILKIVFGYTRCNISRLMRNLDRRWRITCRYRSRDQNGNFRKFKMADGCHIENRFRLYLGAILADVWKLDSRRWIACKQRSRDQKSNFRQFNMAAAATLIVVFFGVLAYPSFL